MRLAYKIPHKVTLRMVGAMFVATCSCRDWAQMSNPRGRDGMSAIFPGLFASVVTELIGKAHEHASDHVLEQQGLTRKVAA